MHKFRLLVLGGLVSACGVGDATDSGPEQIVNDEIPAEGTATIHSILQGTFAPLPGYDGISGVAELVRTVDGNTMVSLQLAGLGVSLEHNAHVHAQPCAQTGGGHYKMDPLVLETVEANEIWPVFTSDEAGIGRGFVTAAHLARGEALSIVVHDPEGGGKMACADLVAQDEGITSTEGAFAVIGVDLLDANIAGSAKLDTTGTTTTVTLSFTGLDLGSTYVSHVHALPCEIDNGGGHYKMDPSVIDVDPLNELSPIIPAGLAATDALLGPVTHNARADAQSVVLHRVDGELAPKVACANLVRALYPSSTMSGTETLIADGATLAASATIERRLDGVTGVTLDATSLNPNAYYNAHLHNLPCDVANGGGHYKIDSTVTEAVRTNEMWFGLKADGEGVATATGFASEVARAEAQSIVIHDSVSGDRQACVSLK
jgi:hypothetical protein